MVPDVHFVLVEHGGAHEREALDVLLAMLRRVRPAAAIHGVVVDNANPGADDHDPDDRGVPDPRDRGVLAPRDRGVRLQSDPPGVHAVRIAGDNTVREFSGWDRGLAWLDEHVTPSPGALVVLANDTIARPDKRERVLNVPEASVDAAEHGALAGLVEEYPQPVELFGLPMQRFVDTSLVIATRGTWAALGPLAQPPADADVFADDWRAFFREPSPLSDNYRAYLRAYFFDEPPSAGHRTVGADLAFDHRWHAHEPLSARNAQAFREKLRCVFCEHLLSARAQLLGLPFADIRRPPRVSVVIPCFNHGAFLDEAVDSVLAQTFQDVEIIVVDDGSTDAGTQALLADYRRPRTRVIRSAHVGVSAARNAGIAQAAGAYLCTLDADDRLEPPFLEKAVRVLDDDPSLAFASCWLHNFGDEAWDWTPERCDLPALLCEDTVCTAALVRRDAVVAIGGFDAEMPYQGGEDWELWLTLVERGYRGVILPEVLFNYRRRGDGLNSVAWYGEGHMPLARYRIAKHRDSYQAHLLDVFRHQDVETAALLRRNDELERYIGADLEPSIAARREELAQLRERLARLDAPADPRESATGGSEEQDPPYVASAHDGRTRALEASLTTVAAERDALRTSMSWRVTAPLRTVYGWWLHWRGLSAEAPRAKGDA